MLRRDSRGSNIHRLFFVHQPKTGGNAIEAWLKAVLGRHAYVETASKHDSGPVTSDLLESFLHRAELGSPSRPPGGATTEAFVLHCICCCPASYKPFSNPKGSKSQAPILPDVIRRLAAVRYQWGKDASAPCDLHIATLVRRPLDSLLSWFVSHSGALGSSSSGARYSNSPSGFRSYLNVSATALLQRARTRLAAGARPGSLAGALLTSSPVPLDQTIGSGTNPQTAFLVGDLVGGFRRSSTSSADRGFRHRVTSGLLLNATSRSAIRTLALMDTVDTYESSSAVPRFLSSLTRLLRLEPRAAARAAASVGRVGSSSDKSGGMTWHTGTGGGEDVYAIPDSVSFACALVQHDQLLYEAAKQLAARRGDE